MSLLNVGRCESVAVSMCDYVNQTRDQYLVVLPEMHVNFPIFISVEMYFKLNFERVVAQLKDVVIFL